MPVKDALAELTDKASKRLQPPKKPEEKPKE